MFDSAKIVYADAIKDKIEVRLLTKIAIGLGYSFKPLKYHVKRLALSLTKILILKNLKKNERLVQPYTKELWMYF